MHLVALRYRGKKDALSLGGVPWLVRSYEWTKGNPVVWVLKVDADKLLEYNPTTFTIEAEMNEPDGIVPSEPLKNALARQAYIETVMPDPEPEPQPEPPPFEDDADREAREAQVRAEMEAAEERESARFAPRVPKRK